jgi:hypothetical protein
MTHSLTELNALCRLFLFHLNEVYTVKEMRAKLKAERVVIFDLDEIDAEIEANDLANDLG